VELISTRFSNLGSKVPGAQRAGMDGSIQCPAVLYPQVRVTDPIKPENQFAPGVGNQSGRREASIAATWENVGQPAGGAFSIVLGTLSPGIWHVTANWFYSLTLGAAAADVVHKAALSWFPANDSGVQLLGTTVMDLFKIRRVANVPGVTGVFEAEFSLETNMSWTANADVQPAAGAGYFEVWQGHFLAQRVF
jgi:hypothetical protein